MILSNVQAGFLQLSPGTAVLDGEGVRKRGKPGSASPDFPQDLRSRSDLQLL
jgi:hypothetical protein